MKTGPLVSVLMTSYNRELYIGEAIQSVLDSDYENFELIIVDDGSKDKTVEIARSYANRDSRVSVYVNEKNLGDYPNRNKAASYAQGKYIKYLDADDLIYYYGLGVMVGYMERFPDAGFGLASVVSNDAPFPICLSPREAYLEHFGPYAHFNRAPCSSIIKLEAFNKVGGFSGKRMIGDYEMWFKLSRYFSMVKFPFDLYWNRVHENQESQTPYAKENYSRLQAEVLDAALNHPDIPLSLEELGIIRKNLKKAKAKNAVANLLTAYKRK